MLCTPAAGTLQIWQYLWKGMGRWHFRLKKGPNPKLDVSRHVVYLQHFVFCLFWIYLVRILPLHVTVLIFATKYHDAFCSSLLHKMSENSAMLNRMSGF